MVYGRLMFNNLKEYTPQFIKTIPHSQTVKPLFRRGTHNISSFNSRPFVRDSWMMLNNYVNFYPNMWHLFVVAMTMGTYYMVLKPFHWFYKLNNGHRTYEAAYRKEKAYKKIKKEQEEAEEAEE